jgi:hypothetical protein
LTSRTQFTSRRWRWTLWLVIAVAVGARLALAWLIAGNYDSESYGVVASIVHAGGNVYAQTDRYNYSPFWFLVLGGPDPVALAFHVSVAHLARTLLTVVDVATAAILWRMAGPVSATVFLANPVSIVITGYHGAFDSIAILLVLLALRAERRGTQSGWWLAAAVLVKETVAPALLFVPLRSRPKLRSRLKLAAQVALGFVVILLPWATSTEAISGMGANIVFYAFGIGEIGWHNVGQSFSILPVLWRVLLYALLIVLAVHAPRLGWHRMALAWTLVLVAAAPSTPQLYVLPLAIAALRPGRWLVAYSLLCTLALLGSPQEANVHALAMFGGWLVAIVALGWLASLLVTAVRSRQTEPHPIVASPTTR